MKPDFDLLVIGGGMVGACFAALAASDPELSRLRIAVLETHPPTKPPVGADVDLRVSAISRGSQRILESIDAWSRIPPQHVSAYSEMTVWDARGRPRGAGSLHFSAAQTSEPSLGAIVENRRVQWGIYESPAMRSRVTLLRAELAGLQVNVDEAFVTLADGRRIGAELIVGADGAGSLSRKLAGIETRGWEYDQHAFVTHVSTEYPHARTAWQRFLPSGPIAFLPLADGRSSIVWTTTPDHAQFLVSCEPEQLASELTEALGGALGQVGVSGPRAQFPLRLTHALQYCKSRFVLVGDAAHAVHPLAGQGVNLGFLDCAALVQTLSCELAGGSKPTDLGETRVLRRYERWRRSENALALGLIDGLNRLFSNSSSLLGWARQAGLSVVDRSALAKRFFIGRAMGTGGDAPAIVNRAR
ncbi:UbiH/UbiF/VisC/COQ6 family ubiquinone biosynthesis hydroxylase [Povalibacter sp.]|uniref:UbiH/UbiF/VisC/COQ6 family ubiquinone biosynthesis hydroxylase n=1 Tax=Povalibacter sp. TaxID=1962978 RepID=UPI002F404B7B